MVLTPAQDIIGGLAKRLGLDEKIAAVFKIWDRELGALAKHLKVAGIQNGMLVVEAGSSAHMQEGMLRRREIIKKINQHFPGEKVIKTIKIKLKD